MAAERCDLDKDEAASSSPSPLPPPPSSPPPSLFLNSPQEFSPPRPLQPEAEAPAAADGGADADRKETQPATGSVIRCSTCRKRVGLAGFRCRCGELFCRRHRYSDTHDCSFDYKAAGREEIARNNPVVRAAKIIKL